MDASFCGFWGWVLGGGGVGWEEEGIWGLMEGFG